MEKIDENGKTDKETGKNLIKNREN